MISIKKWDFFASSKILFREHNYYNRKFGAVTHSVSAQRPLRLHHHVGCCQRWCRAIEPNRIQQSQASSLRIESSERETEKILEKYKYNHRVRPLPLSVFTSFKSRWQYIIFKWVGRAPARRASQINSSWRSQRSTFRVARYRLVAY